MYVEAPEFYLNMDLINDDKFMSTEVKKKACEKVASSGFYSSARRTNRNNNDVTDFENQ